MGKLFRPAAHRLAALFFIGTLINASPAIADSTKDAMKAFGLVGPWSMACTEKGRNVFSIPFFGAPTMEFVVGNELWYRYEIEEAVIVDDDRIRGRMTILKMAAQPDWSYQQGERWEFIYQKVGNKVKLLSLKQHDGAKKLVEQGLYLHGPQQGKETVLLEKCSN